MKVDITPQDEITSSGVVTAKSGALHGFIIKTDGTNAVTLNVYDNATEAAGRQLIPDDTIITTSGTDRLQSIQLPPGRYENGLYFEITTSGATGIIAYIESY